MNLRDKLRGLKSLEGTINDVFIWSDAESPPTPSRIGKIGASYLRLAGDDCSKFVFAYPMRIDKGEKVRMYLDPHEYDGNYMHPMRAMRRIGEKSVEDDGTPFPEITLRALEILDSDGTSKCVYFVSR